MKLWDFMEPSIVIPQGLTVLRNHCDTAGLNGTERTLALEFMDSDTGVCGTAEMLRYSGDTSYKRRQPLG